MRQIVVVLAVFSGVLTTQSVAKASPWTLPEKNMALSLAYDFQTAGQEYHEAGDVQNFPLDGQFTSSTLRFNGRYGLMDDIELSLELSFKDVVYSADPAIIEFPGGAESADLATARKGILNFNRRATGVSDIFAAVRYNISNRLILVTSETRIKLPSGYKAPQSTINDKGIIVDDVALGDAQIDIEESILFGTFVNTSKTFVRVDMGGRLRFGAPGHQFMGSIKVGQFLGSRLVITGNVNGTVTFLKGEKIGESFVAKNGNVTASNVSKDKISSKPLFLDKDFLTVGLGALFIVKKGVELQLSGNRFILGKNIPVITSVTFASSFSFNIMD